MKEKQKPASLYISVSKTTTQIKKVEMSTNKDTKQ